MECSAIRPGSVPLTGDPDEPPCQNCQRLVLLGSAKVGKTAIVSRFLQNKYDDNYTPTIENFHRKIYKIRGECFRLDILDTSGNHPFPAMRRLSLLTGDIFILVYSIDHRESFDEVKRLQEQILQVKGQSTTGVNRIKRKGLIPMVIVGNKCDKELSRQVSTTEMRELSGSYPSCACLEASAKKNINIEEIFLKLFVLAKLPTEMSPSLHHKVQPSYIVTSSPRASRRRMTLRRRLSDAYGAVTPNVRRPSIRTDLLKLQTRQNRSDQDIETRRDARCIIQ